MDLQDRFSSEILNRLRWARRRFRHQTVSLDDNPADGNGSAGPVQLSDNGLSPEAALQMKEREEAIQAALDKLSRQHRSIVVLRDIQVSRMRRFRRFSISRLAP